MSILRSPASIVAALLYATVSLVCTQVPLLNYLGYEFSALLGLLSSFIAGLLTIRLVRHAYLAEYPSDEERYQRTLNAFKQALTWSLLLIVIPLVVMLTNALFVKNCSLLQGLGFFILIPVVSVWFGSALGLLCAVHYRRSKTLFFLYSISLLLYSAAIGYFTPAIYSHNFLYGYFPGLTYDEALGLTWTLILFRICTVVAGVVLVWLGSLVAKHCAPADRSWTKGTKLLKLLINGRRQFITVALALVVTLVWLFRCELGFESTSKFIQEQMGSRHETSHFVIFYSRQSYDDEEIMWIAAEHEFQLKQITDALYIPFRGKIESYIYPSSESKQRLIGTGTTNIAKPWSGQIHIARQSLDGTLKHELVHVLAAPFGLPVIKASLSTGLVEGLAMAIEWDWGNRTPHQYAAGMRKFGVMPNVGPLMLLTGFAQQASSVSYVVCGSFCRFLIDRYGMRKMMQVYRTGDYNLTYSRSLDELINEWNGFLDRITVPEQHRDAIDVIFRRQPIFKKVCARVIAERNIQARKKFEDRDYESAEALYNESYKEGKGYEAFSGHIMSALRAGNAGVVVSALDSIVMMDSHPMQYLPLFIAIGDAYWTRDNKPKARELYTRVRLADLSVGLNESAALRLAALEDTMQSDSLRFHFMSDANDTVRIQLLGLLSKGNPDSWLVRYLQGRMLVRFNRFQESLDLLTSVRLADRDSLLEALRLKMIGYDLFRLRRFQEARIAFWNSLNYLSTEVAVSEVNEWVERCEWMERFGILLFKP